MGAFHMNSVNKSNFTSPPIAAGNFLKEKPCLCFHPDDSVCKIIKKMRENHTFAVSIAKNDKLVGLLTGHDILICATSWQIHQAPSMERIARAFNAMKAGDVMIQNPMTVDKNTTLDEALTIMTENSFRYLSVTTHGKPLGILNIVDVMRYMEEKARGESEAKDEILSYVMNQENYGCVSKK